MNGVRPGEGTAGGCPQCGTAVAAGDRFCSECGTRVERDGASGPGRRETPSAEDRAWLRRRVDDLRADGWSVVDEGRDRVVLRDRGVGRLPVHLLLLVVTGGVGNAVYALYRYTTGAPRKTVYADGTEDGGNDDGRDLATVAAALVAGALVFGGVVWVGLALLANLSAVALAVGALVFVAAALATMLVPTLLRDGVRSPGTFGRERTVERDRVRNPPEPCTACGRRVFRGEHRRYAERLYIAGLPVKTVSSGANTYCAACADETSGPFADHEIAAELDRMRAERDDDRRTRAPVDSRERQRELESEPR